MKNPFITSWRDVVDGPSRGWFLYAWILERLMFPFILLVGAWENLSERQRHLIVLGSIALAAFVIGRYL